MRLLAMFGVLSLIGGALVWTQLGTAAADPDCSYVLDSADEQPGTTTAAITGNELVVTVSGANPNTLYTVWVDFKNRATDALADDYPTTYGALGRGVAPAFATTDGVTSGMGVDPNGIVTDGNGDGELRITLDYALLAPGASPVVGGELLLQGQNRVGGGWLRVYPTDPRFEATLQTVDSTSGLPILRRATAQGFTIVRHPDGVTHGHTPGVGGVDHFPAFKGDFPSDCRANLDVAAGT